MQHVDSVSLNVLCQILKLSKTKSMYSDLVFWALSSNKSLGKLGKAIWQSGARNNMASLSRKRNCDFLGIFKVSCRKNWWRAYILFSGAKNALKASCVDCHAHCILINTVTTPQSVSNVCSLACSATLSTFPLSETNTICVTSSLVNHLNINTFPTTISEWWLQVCKQLWKKQNTPDFVPIKLLIGHPFQ